MNIAFTIGWAAELTVRALSRNRVRRFGSVMLGALYMLPALLCAAVLGAAASHMLTHMCCITDYC